MALLHSHASHHPSLHPILAFALCINLIHLPHYSLWQVTALFATTNLEVDRNTLRLFDLALVYSGGAPSLFTPVDDQHPVFMGPRDCTLTVGGPRRDVVPGRTLLRSLWGDASTGSVPQGLQPNGLMLYPMAFPSDIHQPSISSTIPGSIGLQARICWPECLATGGNPGPILVPMVNDTGAGPETPGCSHCTEEGDLEACFIVPHAIVRLE
jgi:hypothetical protein